MNESSIFAILDAEDIIQGTGFLVADKLGVTCAHVVRSCRKGPGDDLYIRFVGGEETIKVHVAPEHWHESQDVAFLSFPHDVPINRPPFQLRAASESIGASVRGFGFPNTQTQGLYAMGTVYGIITDDQGRELVQLDSREITRGFSGAPVWEVQTHQVVGMVTSIAATDRLGRLASVAFASPSETLATLYSLPILDEPLDSTLQGTAFKPAPYTPPLPPTFYVGARGYSGR